jgi:hypothetical protein
MAKARKSSLRSGHSPIPTASDAEGNKEQVASVEQLKLVLSGHLQPPPTIHGTGFQRDDDSSSDSLVSYDMTPSELSFNPPTTTTAGGGGNESASAGESSPEQNHHRPVSRERKSSLPGGPLSSHPTAQEEAEAAARRAAEGEGEGRDVPPVPPIPTGLAAVDDRGTARSSNKIATQDYAATTVPIRPRSTSKRSVRSRASGAGERALSSSWAAAPDEKLPVMDLNALLRGIDAHVGERHQGQGHLGSVSKPPY